MIGRRAFLAGGALAVLGAHGSDGRSAVVSQGRVKFCVFADIHYKPHAFPHSTKDWLKRILDHAEAEKCDFIIHCGDLCHYPHTALRVALSGGDDAVFCGHSHKAECCGIGPCLLANAGEVCGERYGIPSIGLYNTADNSFTLQRI